MQVKIWRWSITKRNQNKVVIIHTGGTIGMVQGRDGVLRPLPDSQALSHLLPELTDIATIELHTPFSIDSSNIQPQHWLQLTALIRAQCHSSNGFVILHGTDTIAYTAAALSFLLADITQPIIITGAQRPLCMLRSDARANIIDAVELATLDIPETAVLFNNKLLRGNRVQKVSSDRYNAFYSPNFPPLGQLGLHINIDHSQLRHEHRNFFPNPRFDTQVLCLKLHPGLDHTLFRLITPGHLKAIVLQGFGAGNIPLCSHLQQWLTAQRAAGASIAIASQSPRGSVDLSLYEGGQQALALGAIPCHDMTIETSLIKMMLLQGTQSSRTEIEKLFVTALAGELTAPSKDSHG